MPSAFPSQNGHSEISRIRRMFKRYGLAACVLLIFALIASTIVTAPHAGAIASTRLTALDNADLEALDPVPALAEETDHVATQALPGKKSSSAIASPTKPKRTQRPFTRKPPLSARLHPSHSNIPAAPKNEHAPDERDGVEDRSPSNRTPPEMAAEEEQAKNEADKTLIAAAKFSSLDASRSSAPVIVRPPHLDRPVPEQTSKTETRAAAVVKNTVKKSLIIAPKLPSLGGSIRGGPTIVHASKRTTERVDDKEDETSPTTLDDAPNDPAGSDADTPPYKHPAPYVQPLPSPPKQNHDDNTQINVHASPPAPPIQKVITPPLPIPLPRADRPGLFFVQILATPHEDSICAIWDALRAELPDLFEYANRSITRVETGDNQVLFRLRVGAFERRQDAALFCEHLQSKGHTCFVPKSLPLNTER